MMTYPSAARTTPASRSKTSGACPFGYSLYMRSSSGSGYSTGSTSGAWCPRAVSADTAHRATRRPIRSRRTVPRITGRLSGMAASGSDDVAAHDGPRLGPPGDLAEPGRPEGRRQSVPDERVRHVGRLRLDRVALHDRPAPPLPVL